jgi:hypothetical protein
VDFRHDPSQQLSTLWRVDQHQGYALKQVFFPYPPYSPEIPKGYVRNSGKFLISTVAAGIPGEQVPFHITPNPKVLFAFSEIFLTILKFHFYSKASPSCPLALHLDRLYRGAVSVFQFRQVSFINQWRINAFADKVYGKQLRVTSSQKRLKGGALARGPAEEHFVPFLQHGPNLLVDASSIALKIFRSHHCLQILFPGGDSMTSPLISFFITAPCQKTASTDAGLGQMTKQAPRGALHPDFIVFGPGCIHYRESLIGFKSGKSGTSSDACPALKALFLIYFRIPEPPFIRRKGNR